MTALLHSSLFHYISTSDFLAPNLWSHISISVHLYASYEINVTSLDDFGSALSTNQLKVRPPRLMLLLRSTGGFPSSCLKLLHPFLAELLPNPSVLALVGKCTSSSILVLNSLLSYCCTFFALSACIYAVSYPSWSRTEFNTSHHISVTKTTMVSVRFSIGCEEAFQSMLQSATTSAFCDVEKQRPAALSLQFIKSKI